MKTLLLLLCTYLLVPTVNAQYLRPSWLFTVAQDGYNYSGGSHLVASDGCVYSSVHFISGNVLGLEGTNNNWTNILIKLSPRGKLIWTKHYPCPNNLTVSGIQELENGNIVFCINNTDAIRTEFSPIKYGSFETSNFGASFLTLTPDGKEVNLIETPRPVWSCMDFIVRQDTIFAAFNLIGNKCVDPYEWNKRNSFKCKSIQVRAFSAKDGRLFWESKASSGSLLQGLTIEDVQAGKVLVCGFYHDGDLKWGRYSFEDIYRNNTVIAVLDSKSGKINSAQCFHGDDLEMINTAAFGTNGNVYAGGFSTGTYMKGPNFDFKKKSKQASSLLFELDSELNVLSYCEGWGDHDNRMVDMVPHDSVSNWFIGGFTDKEWHILDTVIMNSHADSSNRISDGFLIRVSTDGKLLQSKLFSGTERVVLNKITKVGSKIMITGFYEGSWYMDGFYAPEAKGTNAFYLMIDTHPNAP